MYEKAAQIYEQKVLAAHLNTTTAAPEGLRAAPTTGAILKALVERCPRRAQDTERVRVDLSQDTLATVSTGSGAGPSRFVDYGRRLAEVQAVIRLQDLENDVAQAVAGRTNGFKIVTLLLKRAAKALEIPIKTTAVRTTAMLRAEVVQAMKRQKLEHVTIGEPA